MKTILPLAFGFMLYAAAAAFAQSGSISVTDAWARASNVSTGAVYLTIVNSGSTADKLIAVESPVAGMAHLHTEIDDHGIMRMRPVDAIEVGAKGKATLAPGGYHIMLMGLKHPLKNGQHFTLTLTFEKAGKVAVTVSVSKRGPADHSMGDMKM